MNDLSTLLRIVFRTALFFMSFCLLLWAVVPVLKPYAAGFLLGMVISLANAWILRVKTAAIVQLALSSESKRLTTGYLSRASMVAVGTAVCLQFPDHFNLVTTVVGFFFVQLVTLVIGLATGRYR